MRLVDLDDPGFIGPDWVVLRPRLTGICGSDAKQVFMDAAPEDIDNCMTALISFPQVLGVEVGQRVVLNPWLSCGPRGIVPRCPACEAGDFNLCWNFTEGRLSPGIHT